MRRWLIACCALLALGATPVVRGAPHDFDFEFGLWNATLRVRAPLSTANSWTQYTGISTVTPIWGGLANYGILDVRRGDHRIRALTLRLFQPESQQWFIRFANSKDGKLGIPTVGGFQNGTGVFYDREPVNGKLVDMRFVFSDVTRNSFKFQQSYSSDGGTTWVVNWEATFMRRF